MSRDAGHEVRGKAIAAALIAAACVEPTRGSQGATLWLNLAGGLWNRISAGSACRSAVRAVVPLTADLVRWATEAGVVHAVNGDHFYAEVHDSGWFGIKYQHIIGSRQLACLAPDEIDALCQRLARCLMETAPAPVLGAAQSAQSLAASGEIALLTVQGNTIRLPEQRLTTYAAIKAAIEKAGGRYRTGGYFSFPDGLDARAVLAALAGDKVRSVKQETQFFRTPEPLASEICDAAGDVCGRRVLEPSAGDGALADELRRRGAEVVLVEIWPVNIRRLQSKGYAVIDADFLELTPGELGLFDAIVANPPFSRGQDIAHVRHMWHFLKPGGALSVVMSPGWLDGSQRRHREFKAFVAANEGIVRPLPPGTFAASGTNIATVHVSMRKPPHWVALHETAELFA